MSTTTVSPPVHELLLWIARCPRTYAEAIEVWRTHCPRLSAWEDALDSGLVAVVRNGDPSGSMVTLTDTGRAALDSNR